VEPSWTPRPRPARCASSTARAQLAPDVSVGDTVYAQDSEGHRFRFVVLDADEKIARLDANHPLAGKDVVFELTVKSVEGIKTNA
jgi:FKBP-type peptidyl-prolyl cis-trans isomerase 2